MKIIIQLILAIFWTTALINIVIFVKNLVDGFYIDALFSVLIAIALGVGIHYLIKFYNKLVEKAEVELNQKIEQETQLALKKRGYELRPTLSYFLVLLLIFVLMGITPLYFGIKLMQENTESAMAILLWAMIVFGVFFGFALLHFFFLLVGKPIIRINQHGISHFMLDFIDWKDITGIYLHTLKTQGSNNYSLEVIVSNPQHYNPKHKSLFGRFNKKEQISLLLPASGKNARIAEAVSVAFAEREGAPLAYIEVEFELPG
jgi:hypothetical protein